MLASYVAATPQSSATHDASGTHQSSATRHASGPHQTPATHHASGPAQTPATHHAPATRHAHRRRARTPRQIARSMLPHFHWGPHQFKYLNWLWSHESGWNPYAANPYSGAYGIPQAMPGYQMASAGRGWHWNARTQIRWGMRYIRGRYGSPRRAWWHETGYGWY